MEEFSLTDSLDHEILMHREAHFGGNFAIMRAYYEEEDRVGIHPEITVDRIAYLESLEEERGENLAELLLSDLEKERVLEARAAYRDLKAIYSVHKEKNPHPRLIADLIFSESDYPEKELEKVAAEGVKIIPSLLSILKSPQAFDPLFPGYGLSPYYALLALNLLATQGLYSPEAIPILFELLGKELLFEEEALIAGLKAQGNLARDFLLKILKSRPLTEDNSKASIALAAFSEELSVARAAIQELKNKEIWSRENYWNYLLYLCEENREPEVIMGLKTVSALTDLPPKIKKEILALISRL